MHTGGRSMIFKGLFFDLDGTLVDSHRAHWDAILETAKDLGFIVPQNIKAIQHIVGGTYYRFFNYFLSLEGVGEIERQHLARFYAKIAARRYHTHWVERVECYPFVKHLLSDVRHFYPTVGLVTSNDRTTVELTLKWLKIDAYFDVVVTKDDVDLHKPDPLPYIHAAKLVGVDPRRSVAIEDARVGIAAAITANMTTVGITTSETRATLLDCGANFTVADHHELHRLLRKLAMLAFVE